MTLKTHFKTIADAIAYLEAERFERVFDEARHWISHDGLINAELMGGNTCYVIEYAA